MYILGQMFPRIFQFILIDLFKIPLGKPRFAKDAYPSKFPGCPKYLSQVVPQKRRAIIKTELPVKGSNSSSISPTSSEVYPNDQCTTISNKMAAFFGLGDSILRRVLVEGQGVSTSRIYGKLVVNFCIGGQTISQLRKRVARSRSDESEWFVPRNTPLLVLIGTNDILKSGRASVVFNNLKRLLSTLEKWSWIITPITLCTPPPIKRASPDVRHQLHKYKRRLEHCVLIDVMYLGYWTRRITRATNVTVFIRIERDY
ncbi:uncharacterized protein LOC116181569 [Photinus pyralis]|uniref:uncharacterized protein LOC116169245 n=1 Tax=Photinus pyralis TaxID=7054 RepID=UPI0012671372|nr:uncharacterized protein LOC116169245 [Photinus pyralis]XP_031357800.1 uncharacterized protein LOC116181569 [Photinus pyralis]